MKIQILLIFIAILCFYPSDLQAISNSDDIEKVLQLRNTKRPLRKLKEGQLFRHGEEVVYQIRKTSYLQKGKIIEIADDYIVIDDMFGKHKTIKINDLKVIRRKYTLQTYLAVVLFSSFFLVIMILHAATKVFGNSRYYLRETPLLAWSSILLSATGTVLGYFWTKKYMTYYITKKWKAEVISIEKS